MNRFRGIELYRTARDTMKVLAGLAVGGAVVTELVADGNHAHGIAGTFIVGALLAGEGAWVLNRDVQRMEHSTNIIPDPTPQS